jgi:bifunctional DNA-binding transcriptional regulator/antitoxin component of YhaV-PrlF toxin-antitoxin module
MNLISNLSHGRTVIPAGFRQQLGIQDGDQLVWSVQGDALLVTTRRAQLRKAQALFQSFAPQGSPSVADELIAERRTVADSE